MSIISDSGDGRYAFRLMIGGPLHRTLARAHLSGPALEFLRRRIVVVLLVAWLPLFVLSALEGTAWSGVDVPFLKDIASQARLLIALPLLLAAECVVQRRVLHTVPRFVDRGLIGGEQRERLVGAIRSARRLLDSVPAEAALLALVYAVALSGALPHATTLATDTWRGKALEGHHAVTLAGWWATLVSLPLFHFLLVRWYFRMLVWWRFTWHLSRIELNLEPLHPDGVAGLGFLLRLSSAFALFLLAQGVNVAGVLADQIIYDGAVLSDFRVEIAATVAISAIIVIGPLFAFVPVLGRAKEQWMMEYEALSMQYVQDFNRKWLSGREPAEPLLGNADVQSLADLGNGYELVRRMLVLPIDKATLVRLLAAVLAPMLPLLLTMFSLSDMASRVVAVLF